MTPHDSYSSAPDPSAPFFYELRAEVSLLRRAVERLTDERASQPDYAPSLEAVSKRLEDVCTWARRVSDTPALKLTPEKISREIEQAAAHSRAEDQQLLQQAAAAMETSGNRLDIMSKRLRSAAEQDQELRRNRIAFAIAGMVLMAILPGALARSLPANWAVPERAAARMLGTDMWRGGEDMMIKADAARWRKLLRETASGQK